MSDFFAEWNFRPEVVEAMRAAYRMACDAPQLRFSADERTAMVAEKFYEDVELFVTDFCGSFYGLRRACRLTSDGWVSSEGEKPLKVMPVQWKPVR
jgi:hypothetical protein